MTTSPSFGFAHVIPIRNSLWGGLVSYLLALVMPSIDCILKSVNRALSTSFAQGLYYGHRISSPRACGKKYILRNSNHIQDSGWLPTLWYTFNQFIQPNQIRSVLNTPFKHDLLSTRLQFL